MRILALALVFAAAAASALAQPTEVQRGRQIFIERCGLCHTAAPGDGEGGQGPALAGVVGRRAAGDPTFAYTSALKAVRLTWTRANLDRYVKDPSAMAPGTSMPQSLDDLTERRAVIAYLATVRAR